MKTEILYRTVIALTKDGDACGLACRTASEMGVNHGSCTGIGLSKITLLADVAECGRYSATLRENGIQNYIVTESESPHRPENWNEPCYR